MLENVSSMSRSPMAGRLEMKNDGPFLSGSSVYICFNYYARSVPDGKGFSPHDRVGIFTDESNSFRISDGTRVPAVSPAARRGASSGRPAIRRG
ncbi:hypothetical protein [Burkholderia sp. MSMB1078WGS]|uniref:hypothetical protein n=1 Tax=Burkholderia sp. MSMB1078WGS TaxID=1637900 RepID=UPI0012E355E3|nr:hypothetical protein [Burkholderia sp. MSMB1078WGS]